MKKTLFIFLLVGIATIGKGQKQNCNTAIKQAEELYKTGQYSEVVSLLDNSLKSCKFSKREKEDIYILLTQAYFEQENYDKAKYMVKELLVNDPNFKLKADIYQEDFYNYFNSVKVRPRFSAGACVGLVIPNFLVKKIYSVYDSVDYSAPYKEKIGYSLSAITEFQFLPDLSVKLTGGYSSFGYERELKSTGTDEYSLLYSENLKYAQAGLSFKKYFLKGRLKPFVEIGYALDFLQKAVGNVELTYSAYDNLTASRDAFETSKSKINVSKMRNHLQGSISPQIGASFKERNLVLSLNAGYMFGTGKNFTDSKQRYQNSELLFKYYYVDNEMQLNRMNASFSVAYVINYSIKYKK